MPQAHKKGVTCITVIMVSQQEAVFASASSDGTVNVWEIVLPSTRGGEKDILISSQSSFSRYMIISVHSIALEVSAPFLFKFFMPFCRFRNHSNG